MEFRLLGALEARSGDRSLSLGGPKQRAVLAVLLLHANEVVTAERLIDEVWGEQPPPSAGAYLQNCISRLRKELDPGRVETRSPGYVLRAAADEIDVRRFEQLVASARGFPPTERAAALRAALSLWRGTPLVDFTYEPFARPEIARLEALRLTAIEERVATDLELGLHAELLGELESLVDRYPLSERLRSAQLLALYRSGRQADALRVYQEARLALVEELGLEPGEELKQLERMILAHDPALELEATARAAAMREARKTVAVLCAELVLDDRLDPEVGRRVTSAALATVRAIVERHGGTIEQLLGEEVVAVFGVPLSREDDVLRAARAAVETRAEARVPVRGALDAGELIVGGERLAGPALSAARRLRERARAGQILVGEAARRLLGPAVEMTPQRGLERVLEGAPSVPRRLETPLVGRQVELGSLRAAFDDVVREGACRRVVLAGEPGIGKSRLAAELAGELSGSARVLTGRCVPYGEGATYLPLAEILRGLGDPREVVGGDDGELAAVRLGGVLGGNADASGAEIFWATRRVLEAAARGRPLVLVLEDVHWAEPTFLDLVDYLAGWSEAPVLLLCLARSELTEVRPEWRHATVTLGPLSELDARTLADSLPERPRVSPDAVDDAVRAAEGNPLFLEQLLALAAEGELGGVPPSLELLIAGRLDRLDPDVRDVVARAAVAGREFWLGAVEALADDGGDAVAGRLMTIVRRRLARPDSSSLAGEDGFRFHHALIRDVAYAGLPKETRATLHERLARWLDRHPDAADEVVGYHLEQAYRYRAELGDGDPELGAEAGVRLGEAGLRALRRSDAPAAVNLLGRATALVPGRLELACELGIALKGMGDYARAEAVLDEVIRAAARKDQRAELWARIERTWPRLLRGEGSPDEGLALAERAIAVFERDGDERALGRAWLFVAAVRGRLQCRHAESEEAAERALGHTVASGFSPAGLLSMLAADAYYGPRPVAEAIARCEELLVTAGPDAEADVLLWLAGLEAMRGDFDAAHAQVRRARALLAELGFGAGLIRDLPLVAAEIELLADAPEAAEEVLRDACVQLESAGDTAWLATLTAVLAEALYAEGRFDEALALSATARDRAVAGDLYAEVAWRRVRAKALARAGARDEARRLATEAVELLETTDQLNERAKAQLDLGEVLRLTGRARDAATAVRRGLKLLEAKGNEALARQREPERRAPSAERA